MENKENNNEWMINALVSGVKQQRRENLKKAKKKFGWFVAAAATNGAGGVANTVMGILKTEDKALSLAVGGLLLLSSAAWSVSSVMASKEVKVAEKKLESLENGYFDKTL